MTLFQLAHSSHSARSWRARGWRAGALIAAAVSGGCQVWLDVDEPQCKRDEACVALLGAGTRCGASGVCVQVLEQDAPQPSELPARWACLREPTKDFIPDPDRTLRLRMDVVDVVTLRVPEGLRADACMLSDVECAAPLFAQVTPGSDGFMEFELPYGFQGFIRLAAPNYIPALSYDSRPYTESLTTSGPAVITPGVLNAISTGGGSAADPERGLVFLEIRDCNDAAGDGVRIEDVGAEPPFYFEGALPARDLSATAISNQLGAGREPRAVGGFSNLQPGYTTFHAVLPQSGDSVSRVTVQVRAGHITYVRMRAGY
jgi:hypothetical protein